MRRAFSYILLISFFCFSFSYIQSELKHFIGAPFDVCDTDVEIEEETESFFEPSSLTPNNLSNCFYFNQSKITVYKYIINNNRISFFQFLLNELLDLPPPSSLI